MSRHGFLWLVLLSLAACRGRSQPDIIVILIDTLRADRLGCYGNAQHLTPFMDELAARGTLFAHAYSTSAWTFPAVASLFTSRYPQQHHVVQLDSRMAEGEITLAERLRTAQYWTGGYSAHFQVNGSLGVTQGFGEWFASPVKEVVSGHRLTRIVLSGLAEGCLAPRRPPCFLYLHYMEPHGPYEPRQPFRDRFLRLEDTAVTREANDKLIHLNTAGLSTHEVHLLASLYDGEVATVDAELRTLFGELERRGLLSNAIVVITADHGEEFREHGGMAHGTSLYDEMIHIPLLILAPAYQGGHTVEENVSLVDVAPTLLELSGLAPEPRFEGRSLVPLMKRAPPAGLTAWLTTMLSRPAREARGEWARDVIVQLEPSGSQVDLRRHAQGIMRGTTKLLVHPSGETATYDLAKDPAEKEPNPAALSASQPILDAALKEAEADLQRRASQAESAPLDDGTSERLRALGYETF